MEQNVRPGDTCIECQKFGLQHKLREFCINFEEKIVKCESDCCMYPYLDETLSEPEKENEMEISNAGNDLDQLFDEIITDIEQFSNELNVNANCGNRNEQKNFNCLKSNNFEDTEVKENNVADFNISLEDLFQTDHILKSNAHDSDVYSWLPFGNMTSSNHFKPQPVLSSNDSTWNKCNNNSFDLNLTDSYNKNSASHNIVLSTSHTSEENLPELSNGFGSNGLSYGMHTALQTNSSVLSTGFQLDSNDIKESTTQFLQSNNSTIRINSQCNLNMNHNWNDSNYNVGNYNNSTNGSTSIYNCQSNNRNNVIANNELMKSKDSTVSNVEQNIKTTKISLSRFTDTLDSFKNTKKDHAVGTLKPAPIPKEVGTKSKIAGHFLKKSLDVQRRKLN